MLPLITCMTLNKALNFPESQGMEWVLEETSEPDTILRIDKGMKEPVNKSFGNRMKCHNVLT